MGYNDVNSVCPFLIARVYPTGRERTKEMIISPKYDDMMKELFHNETVLRYFLSDILRVCPDRIWNLRLKTPFLRKRGRKEKQGILDVVAEFGDDTKVNVEPQVRIVRNWDKRQLFYLAKMYTEELIKGEDYSRLKRCVGISLLDFNLSDRPKYHTVYRLRDEEGNEFTDALEIHVLELGKPLTGKEKADEWIQFFNVETEEDLRMIKAKTKNPGILEAIRELRRLSLDSPMKWRYDAYLKRKRDEKAREAYVWEEGEAKGRAEGKAEGRTEGESYKLVSMVCRKLRKGKEPERIAEELEEEVELIQRICQVAKEFGPGYDDEKVFKAYMER
jgi:predicted transposase/invertase (TIGR01784 family)